MRRSSRRLTIVLSAVGAVALGCMMLHTILNSVLRTVGSSPIYGTYEIVESWYLPIIALGGLIAAQLQGEHIQVRALIERLPEGQQRSLEMIRAGGSATLCFIIAVFSLLGGLEDAAVGMTAGVTTIIIWPFILLVPVAFAALGSLYIADLRTQMWDRKATKDHELAK